MVVVALNRMCRDCLLKQYLYEYAYNLETWYTNDYITLGNNVNYRSCDAVDHLEMIMAKARLGVADRVQSDLIRILSVVSTKQNE